MSGPSLTSPDSVAPPHVPVLDSQPAVAREGTADICWCGHDLDGHDAIATRFCRATVSGALSRGCVCDRATPVATRPRNARTTAVTASLGHPSTGA
jgi:hypothetical protein